MKSDSTGKVFEALRGYQGTVIHEYRYTLFRGSAKEDSRRMECLLTIINKSGEGRRARIPNLGCGNMPDRALKGVVESWEG